MFSVILKAYFLTFEQLLHCFEKLKAKLRPGNSQTLVLDHRGVTVSLSPEVNTTELRLLAMNTANRRTPAGFTQGQKKVDERNPNDVVGTPVGVQWYMYEPQQRKFNSSAC